MNVRDLGLGNGDGLGFWINGLLLSSRHLLTFAFREWVRVRAWVMVLE